MKLENVENLQLAHPYVKGFDRMYYCLDNAESVKVSAGDVPPEVAKRTKNDVEGLPDVITAHLTFFYIGLQIDQPAKSAWSLVSSDDR
jgi:poly(A) polymerase